MEHLETFTVRCCICLTVLSEQAAEKGGVSDGFCESCSTEAYDTPETEEAKVRMREAMRHKLRQLLKNTSVEVPSRLRAITFLARRIHDLT